jgi:hypothetical protein
MTGLSKVGKLYSGGHTVVREEIKTLNTKILPANDCFS